ncbi:MAG: TldD/PmbA family protein [Candidatus Odinarchaeota archaeon]
MIDLLNDALTKLARYQYVELRHQHLEGTTIIIEDNSIQTASTGVTRGTGIRILHDGAWGLAATTDPSLAAIIKAANEAGIMAKKGSSYKKDKIVLSKVPVHESEFQAEFKRDLRDMSVVEKLEKFIDASNWAKKSDKVVNSYFYYNEAIDEVSLVTSEGISFVRAFQKPTIRTKVVVAEHGQVRPASKEISKTCGAEIFDTYDPLVMVQEAYQQAIRLLGAKLVKSGLQNIVLDHGLVGLLAHEAVGHTAESDLVLSGSFLQGKIGENVANDLVSLSDSPIVGDAAGWIPVDDEGVVGKKVEIIKDGILKNYLVNKADSSKLGQEPTGNARAYLYRDIPLVRMRNTYLEPGDMSNEELFEVVKDGYFLKGSTSGQADSNGEFMFGTEEALEIKNGKLTGISFVGPTISGNAFDVLKSVNGVGKAFKMDMGAGFCGKGQLAKVDGGGPLIACKALLGGQ